MRKAPISPAVKKAFRGVPATQKAMRVAQKMLEAWQEVAFREITQYKAEMRDTVPQEERVSLYNSGYLRACEDLFGVKDRSGMRVFSVGGRVIAPGEDGRIRLEEDVMVGNWPVNVHWKED